VVGLRYGGVELATIEASASAPSGDELARLATESLLAFNQAIQAKDFGTFYDTLSDVWKQQTTPDQLAQIFQEFMDENVDISPIKDVTPQFAAPAALDENGVMQVAGEFPTQPSQVHFELQYVHQSAGWKLLGISVNVGQKESPVGVE
jgi:hypothetical protein